MATKNNTVQIRNIFIICMLTILMGQFYINPFNANFRFTVLVIFFSLFLIYFKNYRIMTIAVLVGISAFLSQTTFFYLSHDISFENVIIEYAPVLLYYLCFGFLFKILKTREILDQPFNAFLSLLICDSVSNIFEISIRRIWNVIDFNTAIKQIIIVGVIRTTTTLSIYYLIRYFADKFQESERDKYYRQSIMLISRLKTELFFLKKSRDNIEDMVAYVHNCYEETEEEKLKAPFLKIAKDIHEIKKDYLRVITGMNSVFNSDAEIKYMSNKNILNIIEDNVLKLIKSKNKDIVLSVSYEQAFMTDEFYSIISILNNLIINSIDAIDSYGKIDIKTDFNGDDVEFIVSDTGEGIPKDKIEVIFKSGYTTKYDLETGKMSTGLGLAHVHSIVTEYFNGSIIVDSEINKGTKMTIKIPRKRLVREFEIDDYNIYSG